jgi:hypothetical protein
MFVRMPHEGIMLKLIRVNYDGKETNDWHDKNGQDRRNLSLSSYTIGPFALNSKLLTRRERHISGGSGLRT